jgi:hypothetical protein
MLGGKLAENLLGGWQPQQRVGKATLNSGSLLGQGGR